MSGVCYLLGSLTSVFGQMIVLGWLVEPGDAAATAANIAAHESLWRLGSVSSLLSVPFHLVWAALFYELFESVSRRVALLAAFVMLMACAMWTLSSLFQVAPLLVLSGARPLSGLAPEQLQGLAFLFVKLNGRAFDFGLVFFGLWLLSVGYLVVRSTLVPRAIGWLLALAAVGYSTLVWPPLAGRLFPFNLALAGPGEISLMLWLLVKGVRASRPGSEASAP